MILLIFTALLFGWGICNRLQVPEPMLLGVLPGMCTVHYPAMPMGPNSGLKE